MSYVKNAGPTATSSVLLGGWGGLLLGGGDYHAAPVPSPFSSVSPACYSSIFLGTGRRPRKSGGLACGPCPLSSPLPLSFQKEDTEEESGRGPHANPPVPSPVPSLSPLTKRTEKRTRPAKRRISMRPRPLSSPLSLLSEGGHRRGDRRGDGARMLILHFS